MGCQSAGRENIYDYLYMYSREGGGGGRKDEDGSAEWAGKVRGAA